MRKKFYITTSIFYTNAPPHLGAALEMVQADVIARYKKNQKRDVFFLTGTDEHGQKVAKAAKKAKQTPENFCDNISQKFRRLAEKLNLSNNDFIRTTDKKRHWPVVAKVWNKLEENGDIYKKAYKGLYCPGCEAFITRKDLVDGKCAIHGMEPEIIEEENYFFKLSKYSTKIKEIIERDKIRITPHSKKREILNFIENGLEDISFSRARKDLKWGIPVPGDSSQTIYVWADALVNYLSAIGYDKDKKFKKFWPADIHLVGKDILKFHSLIWPAMLISLGISLPKIILVHGFITVNDKKMSKSLGNIIDPFELIDKYGTDALRYYLLKEIPPFEDGDFTYEKFEKRYQGDLANGLGNLIARILGLRRRLKKRFSTKRKMSASVRKEIDLVCKKYKKAMEEFRFNKALEVVWGLIGFCDKQINENKLWELIKKDEKKSQIILNDISYTARQIAILLEPFLPETSKKIIYQLETGKSELLFPIRFLSARA